MIKSKILFISLFLVFFALLWWYLLHDKLVAILQPVGLIAIGERNYFVWIALVGLVATLAVVFSLFYIAYKYREGSKEKYDPEWHTSPKLEFFRWGYMWAFLGVFSIFTWIGAHQLDPWKTINSPTPPLTIEVVSLQWRWLFIYPKYNIATINYIELPEKTPVTFQMTADSPMNSFFIPQVLGQMYSMAGMTTKTHAMINTTGTFHGLSAEISGAGFTNMKFTVKSVTNDDFNSWINSIQNSPKTLGINEYKELSKPNSDPTVIYYKLTDANLFNDVIYKFMLPNSKLSEGK